MKQLKWIALVLTVVALSALSTPAQAACGWCDPETERCHIIVPYPQSCFGGFMHPCFDDPTPCGYGETLPALSDEYAVASVEVKRPEGKVSVQTPAPAVVASLEGTPQR